MAWPPAPLSRLMSRQQEGSGSQLSPVILLQLTESRLETVIPPPKTSPHPPNRRHA
ncbi:Uncharacterised protein [Vibrio cholerae]|nr:Uncharacterised protein [Vibrio cholerae]